MKNFLVDATVVVSSLWLFCACPASGSTDDKGGSPNTSSSAGSPSPSPCEKHATIGECNADSTNGCSWCNVTDACGTTSNSTTLCTSAHAGGQCTPTFELRCGIDAAFKCPNGSYEQAFACPGSALCSNVE